MTFTVQWLRCDPFGGACDAIAGADAWTFVPTLAERGYALRIAVTATNIDGAATGRSSYTGIVPGSIPRPVNLSRPFISGASPAMRVGTRLLGREGTS